MVYMMETKCLLPVMLCKFSNLLCSQVLSSWLYWNKCGPDMHLTTSLLERLDAVTLIQNQRICVIDIVQGVLIAKISKINLLLNKKSNLYAILTLKEAGGVQNDPMGFRLAAISHRIMLWSQKFLTLSIYIPSRR